VTAVLCRAAVAPVLAEANPRSEQVTQMLCGEAARVTDRKGEWQEVRLERDGYTGWLHQGYSRDATEPEADVWRAEAWLSAGAVVALDDGELRLDPGARVLPGDGGTLRLADDRSCRVVSGLVAPPGEVRAIARKVAPEAWALRAFTGTPYLWGGLTPHGVDCSGLVQITYLMRGVPLPRDARQQAECGRAIPAHGTAPGDLLFFAESDGRISHVAFASQAGGLVHAALACGGVVAEPWGEGTRAAPLRNRLVQVRRIDG
jgi:cell wall-associated NlpC family hydrolase